MVVSGAKTLRTRGSCWVELGGVSVCGQMSVGNVQLFGDVVACLSSGDGLPHVPAAPAATGR